MVKLKNTIINLLYAGKKGENIHNELQYWLNISKTSYIPDERDNAVAFASALKAIVKELNSLDSIRLIELQDSANNILGLIDDLWKLDEHEYPQYRMDNVLNDAGNW